MTIMQYILGYLYIFRHLAYLILFVVFISLLRKHIAKKDKRKVILYSVFSVLCACLFLLGFYNGKIRPYETKSKIQVDDMNRLCESLVGQQESAYNVLYEYQYSEDNSNEKPAPKDLAELVTIKKRAPYPVGLKSQFIVGMGFNKGAKQFIEYDGSTNYIWAEVVEFDSEADAKKYFDKIDNDEKKEMLYDFYNERMTEKEKARRLGITTHEKTETYQYIISPTTYFATFVDLHGGDHVRKEENIVIQFNQYVITVSEGSSTENLLLPDLIKKDQLFDPEFKGLRAEKLPEE